MYILTNDRREGLDWLRGFVINKPLYWHLAFIISRNSPNHVGGIKKESQTRNEVLTMIDTILQVGSYSEWERLRLNRLRTLCLMNDKTNIKI
jgi:hypothetical protein